MDRQARTVTLRRAGEADIPRLVDLWMEMMARHHEFEPRMVLAPTAPAAYHSYLLLHCRNPKSIVALAEVEGETVGFCCAYVCLNLPMFAPPEFGFISDLLVTAAKQRAGIGTALFDHVVEWFKGRGAGCVQLQVYHQNALGEAFWRSKGFTPFFERMWLDVLPGARNSAH